MVKVDKKERIRRAYFLERKSIRQIAREFHHARRTVRKANYDPAPPQYTRVVAAVTPVLGPFTAIIDRWLDEDLSSPKKQRRTARRIYHRLVEEHGFEGGESTARRYVRRHRPKEREVYIPLEYDPGSDAQCDFGSGYVVMGDKLEQIQLFCLRLCYSTKPFVMAFPQGVRSKFSSPTSRGVYAKQLANRKTENQLLKEVLEGLTNGSFEINHHSRSATKLEPTRWMLRILLNAYSYSDVKGELGEIPQLENLLRQASSGKVRERNRAISILARSRGILTNLIATFLHVSRTTVYRYWEHYQAPASSQSFGRQSRRRLKAEDENNVNALFSLIHPLGPFYFSTHTSS